LDFYWAFSSVWAFVLYLAASSVCQRAEGPRFPSETGATYTLPIKSTLPLSLEFFIHCLTQRL
jgi:hypothetical protein